MKLEPEQTQAIKGFLIGLDFAISIVKIAIENKRGLQWLLEKFEDKKETFKDFKI